MAILSLHHWVWRGYPITCDEHAYLMQGDLIARGYLSFTGDLPRYWIANCLRITPERWLAMQPPGTTLLLLVATLLGHVALAGAVSGIVCLVALWRIARGWLSPWVAAVTVAWFALTPHFWAHAASYLSQIHALACMLVAVLFTTSLMTAPSGRRLLAVVASVAVLTVIRPGDALAFAGGVTLAFLFVRSWRAPVAAWLGFAAGAATLCAYNWLAVGQVRMTLYPQPILTVIPFLTGATDMSLGEYARWYLDSLQNRTGHLLVSWIAKYSGWLFSVCGAIGLLLVRRIPAAQRAVLCSVAAVVLLLHTSLPFLGWPAFGARYELFVVPVLALLAGTLIQALADRLHRPPVMRVVCAAVLAWQGWIAGLKILEYDGRFRLLDEHFRAISTQCAPGSAVRFVNGRELAGFEQFIEAGLLARIGDPSGVLPAARGLRDRYLVIGHRQDRPSYERYWFTKHPEWRVCFVRLRGESEAAADLRSLRHPFFVPFKGDRDRWREFAPHLRRAEGQPL
jgi:hypothetical protein